MKGVGWVCVLVAGLGACGLKSQKDTVPEGIDTEIEGKQRTRGSTYSVNDFSWSPDGSRLAFSASLNPDLIQGGTSDIYVLSLADNSVKRIVALKGPDRGAVWSPDGKQIAFSISCSSMIACQRSTCSAALSAFHWLAISNESIMSLSQGWSPGHNGVGRLFHGGSRYFLMSDCRSKTWPSVSITGKCAINPS